MRLLTLYSSDMVFDDSDKDKTRFESMVIIDCDFCCLIFVIDENQ